MGTKFKQRFVTGEFEFAEVEADTFAEFVEATVNVADHLGHDKSATRVDPTSQAIQNLQEGGLVPSQAPGLANTPPAQQYQQPAAQQQAQPTTNQYGDIILGTDPVSGKEITHQLTGKFGKPTVKADIFANVPPWHKGPVTIDHAVKFLADKRQWNRENGKG